MITVRVFHEYNGEPAKNQKVALGFDGIISGGVTSYEFTDDRGEVHFDFKPANGTVYVNGNVAFEGYLSERMVVYI
jgi:hypothetical protein